MLQEDELASTVRGFEEKFPGQRIHASGSNLSKQCHDESRLLRNLGCPVFSRGFVASTMQCDDRTPAKIVRNGEAATPCFHDGAREREPAPHPADECSHLGGRGGVPRFESQVSVRDAWAEVGDANRLAVIKNADESTDEVCVDQILEDLPNCDDRETSFAGHVFEKSFDHALGVVCNHIENDRRRATHAVSSDPGNEGVTGGEGGGRRTENGRGGDHRAVNLRLSGAQKTSLLPLWITKCRVSEKYTPVGDRDVGFPDVNHLQTPE